MQRQYFECIMNGAHAGVGLTDRRSKEVAACQFRRSFISIFCIRATHSHLQQQFFVSAPTRVSLSRVFKCGPGLHCRMSCACVEQTVLFFVFDVEARGPILSATKINTRARAEKEEKHISKLMNKINRSCHRSALRCRCIN